jgi:hypothetical protein
MSRRAKLPNEFHTIAHGCFSTITVVKHRENRPTKQYQIRRKDNHPVLQVHPAAEQKVVPTAYRKLALSIQWYRTTSLIREEQ